MVGDEQIFGWWGLLCPIAPVGKTLHPVKLVPVYIVMSGLGMLINPLEIKQISFWDSTFSAIFASNF